MLSLEVYFHLIQTHSYERFYMRTRFEMETLGGSEIAYCISAILHKSVCQVVSNTGSRLSYC